MRRTLTAALASTLLALALPAVASAHHHSRHHHRRAHTVVFRPTAKRSDTTTPTTPTTEAPAATVESFEGGVLKLKLADGSTASGKVTDHTWISCGGSDQFDGGWQGSGAQGQQGDDGNDPGAQGQQGDDGNDGPGSDMQDDEQVTTHTEECGVASLVGGAKVKEAELNFSATGAIWEKVILYPKA
jgi:hypothetical protein